jgi:hypothetical protein
MVEVTKDSDRVLKRLVFVDESGGLIIKYPKKHWTKRLAICNVEVYPNCYAGHPLTDESNPFNPQHEKDYWVWYQPNPTNKWRQNDKTGCDQ